MTHDEIIKLMYMDVVPVNDKPSGVPTTMSIWAQKSPAEILEDLRAGMAMLEAPQSISNVIPKSLWVQLPAGERKYHRYPKRLDFPLCAKRQRREVRQDWKHCKSDGQFEYHPITGERFY